MTAMRLLTLILAGLIALVHLELWFGRGGIPRVISLQTELDDQKTRNEELRSSNERLAAEIADLRTGEEMVEERARSELNMLRPQETLVSATSNSNR